MNDLTRSQIQTIFDFTAKKYIKYYDVQLELVDHIANRIEEMQTEDPKLSFDSALQKVYKSFGIYGFTKVQEQKVREMEKFWNKRLTRYYLDYFKLPKIIITLLIGLVIYTYLALGSMWLNSNPMLFALTLGIGLLYICTGLMSRRRSSKNKLDHPLLLVASYESTMLGRSSIGTSLLSAYPWWIDNFGAGSFNLWNNLFLTAVCSYLIINYHAVMFEFPRKLKEEFLKQYAHLDLEEERFAII